MANWRYEIGSISLYFCKDMSSFSTQNLPDRYIRILNSHYTTKFCIFVSLIICFSKKCEDFEFPNFRLSKKSGILFLNKINTGRDKN